MTKIDWSRARSFDGERDSGDLFEVATRSGARTLDFNFSAWRARLRELVAQYLGSQRLEIAAEDVVRDAFLGREYWYAEGVSVEAAAAWLCIKRLSVSDFNDRWLAYFGVERGRQVFVIKRRS